MAHENLPELSLVDVLNQVQGLQTVADKGAIQSVGALLAKCTMVVGTDLNAVATELKSTSAQIKDFNDSTTRLTRVVIALEVILVVATVLIAISAFKG